MTKKSVYTIFLAACIAAVFPMPGEESEDQGVGKAMLIENPSARILTSELGDGVRLNILIALDAETASVGLQLYRDYPSESFETLKIELDSSGIGSFHSLKKTGDSVVNVSDRDGDFIPESKMVEDRSLLRFIQLRVEEEIISERPKSEPTGQP